jgi:hypothetical protein
MRPADEVVSMFSVSDRKVSPAAAIRSMMWSTSFSERERRSSAGAADRRDDRYRRDHRPMARAHACQASIEAGAVLPSVILRKLAAAGPGNALSPALRMLGRIERTLFTLHWLSDPRLAPAQPCRAQ